MLCRFTVDIHFSQAHDLLPHHAMPDAFNFAGVLSDLC